MTRRIVIHEPEDDRRDAMNEVDERLHFAVKDANRATRKKGFGLFVRTGMQKRIRNGAASRSANRLVERLKREGL
jgi:hypothetical protein